MATIYHPPNDISAAEFDQSVLKPFRFDRRGNIKGIFFLNETFIAPNDEGDYDNYHCMIVLRDTDDVMPHVVGMTSYQKAKLKLYKKDCISNEDLRSLLKQLLPTLKLELSVWNQHRGMIANRTAIQITNIIKVIENRIENIHVGEVAAILAKHLANNIVKWV